MIRVINKPNLIEKAFELCAVPETQFTLSYESLTSHKAHQAIWELKTSNPEFQAEITAGRPIELSKEEVEPEEKNTTATDSEDSDDQSTCEPPTPEPTGLSSALKATSDIPRSLHTIHAMVNELKAQEKEQEEALDEIENSIMAGKQMIHGADIDDANEEDISNVVNVLKELAVTPSEPEHVGASFTFEVVTSSVPLEEAPEKEMPVEPEMVVMSQKDAPVQGELAGEAMSTSKWHMRGGGKTHTPCGKGRGSRHGGNTAVDDVPETSGSSTKNLEAVTTWLRPRK
ncbi:hypothetical protein FRC11_010994 [Ceratobasidium sp. 423]|nr:hypothetical protein FRC11_010994 [Ceratobasidium sp. 423]